MALSTVLAPTSSPPTAAARPGASLGASALVGALQEVGMERDGLVERLGADELLDNGGRLLEGLLGVIGRLDGDRLRALGDDAERRQRGGRVGRPGRAGG